MTELKLHNSGHRHEEEEEIEEEVDIISSPLTPASIFDLDILDEEVPSGFDAVKISIDGTLHSSLNWEKEKRAALHYIEKGYKIFWEINLGLFQELKHPLGHLSQFLSLCLALEHFRDHIWNNFRGETIGLSLYRGSADFSQGYLWDDEQSHNFQEWLKDPFRKIDDLGDSEKKLKQLFCRDVCAEYLRLLANRLPDSLEKFMLFDASEIKNPLLTAQLMTKERFPLLNLVVKGGRSLGGQMGWEDVPLPLGFIGRSFQRNTGHFSPCSVGICLPGLTICCSILPLEELITFLINRNFPFRAIPESHLTIEWEGLDYIIVVSQYVSQQGRRMLQGFCAAGGTVVTIGEALHLPEEMSIIEWKLLIF